MMASVISKANSGGGRNEYKALRRSRGIAYSEEELIGYFDEQLAVSSILR